jgi:GTPase-associated system helical domain
MKEADSQFAIEVDKIEAGLIACLLLTEEIIDGNTFASLSVLTTAFEGMRTAIVPAVTEFALKAASAVTDTLKSADLVYPLEDEAADAIAKAKASLTPDIVADAFLAIVAAAQQNGVLFAQDVNARFAAERRLSNRLSEELNMLWWYVGEWSKLVDKPRNTTGDKAKAIFFGADLATFVDSLPGPYGATAILRKSLASKASMTTTLFDAVDSLDKDEIEAIRTELPNSDGDLFPVTLAVKYAREVGKGHWRTPFEKVTGLQSDLKLSKHQLSVQMYREQVILNSENRE